MNKNKLLWSIVLFLIIVISIPIAYAQTFFEGPIFFILINSLIVGVILFVLQTFLIKDKNTKEQTAVWVAIIVGSLLIGWFFGSQGYIWNHPVFARFFSIYVLVNSIIIGVALYFLSGFLDINKRLGGSPEGKGGLGILIFLVAAIFAVQIGNQWIWHQSVVKQLIDYLFGAQGILNPAPPDYRLWAFLAVTFLLSFFFKGYLLPTGAGGTDKVNYALAILIGSSVARAGISFASIVLLGEAIFTIVLARALQGTAPDVKGKSTNWLLAAFLVGWASAAMTYGTEYQGWLAWIVGTPLWAMGLIQVGPTGAAARPAGTGWFGWIFKMGIGALLIIGLPILLFGFIIGRGNKRVSRMRNWLKKYGLVPILRSMRKSPNPIIKWLLKRWTAKDPYLEGQLPFVFKDLRAELMILMNYQTRLHTYFGKRAKVVEAVNQAKGVEAHFETASKTYDRMRNSLDKYRFGGEDLVEKSYGWSNNRQLISLFFDMLKKDLEADLTVSVTPETRDNYLGNIITKFNEQLNLMAGAYGQFVTNTKRFGLIHRLRSLKIKILDLLTLYGVYKHAYRFANENALFEKWSYDTDKGDPVKWDVSPKERDKSYEEEKNRVISQIREYYLNNIIRQKTRELQGKLYKDYYDEMWAKIEPVIRNQYDRYKEKLNYTEKQKITENVIKRGIRRAVEAKNSEIEKKVAEELQRREKEIREEALFELESEEVRKEIIKTIPNKYKLGFVGTLTEGNIRHEVDVKGFILEDIHKIEIDHKNLSYIRRVKIEDIEDFPGETPELATFSYIFPKMLAEWDFFIEDLRLGTFHPFSRSHIDYTKIVNERSLNFDNAGRTKPDRRQNYAAFDLEALKISGKWVYWGRRNYWDTLPELKNPYPTLSTIGLSRFITEIVRLRAKDNEIADKYLSYWVWDTSREDLPFTTLLGKEEKK